MERADVRGKVRLLSSLLWKEDSLRGRFTGQKKRVEKICCKLFAARAHEHESQHGTGRERERKGLLAERESEGGNLAFKRAKVVVCSLASSLGTRFVAESESKLIGYGSSCRRRCRRAGQREAGESTE